MIFRLVVSATHRRFVLLVDFDGFIGLGGNESAAALVKLYAEDAALRVDTARLYLRVEALEVIARLPVPEIQRSVVGCGEKKTDFRDRVLRQWK